MNFSKILLFFMCLFPLCFCANIIPQSCRITFRKACVDTHNRYRAIHQAPKVRGNITIELVADKYATYLADYNLFQHSQTGGLGENLAYIWTPKNFNLTNCSSFAEQIVTLWYNEYKYYSYNFPGFSMSTGHFTQLVWKSTTDIGCGIAIIKNKVYGVTNYFPPGNYIGSSNFRKNVLPEVLNSSKSKSQTAYKNYYQQINQNYQPSYPYYQQNPYYQPNSNYFYY